MSGGYFDHNQHYISDFIESLKNVIENNKNSAKDEFGDTIGRFYSEEVIEKFKETLFHLEKSYEQIHRIDYLLSGDSSEETFLNKTND